MKKLLLVAALAATAWSAQERFAVGGSAAPSAMPGVAAAPARGDGVIAEAFESRRHGLQV